MNTTAVLTTLAAQDNDKNNNTYIYKCDIEDK